MLSLFFHFSGISSGLGFILRPLSNPVRKMISLSQQLKAQIEDASHYPGWGHAPRPESFPMARERQNNFLECMHPLLVEFWRGSYVPLSLLMTWWTDVPKRGEKEPTVFPSMVGVMLFTTFSGYVFPGTFTVSGLAGSMVIIQVLTQTSQEKEEISSTSCLFLPVVAQATWTQLLRPRIPHRPVSLQHPWPSRSPLHLWSSSHFPIWVESPPLTFAPDLKLQTIPVSAHCFSSPTWSIWAKSRLPVSYLECSSDFLTSQAQTDSFTEPPRSSALGPAYLPVALPLCLLSTSSVL